MDPEYKFPEELEVDVKEQDETSGKDTNISDKKPGNLHRWLALPAFFSLAVPLPPSHSPSLSPSLSLALPLSLPLALSLPLPTLPPQAG
jgi:hypothetical protein